jgi:NADH:ubiquinone reductase (H+-translocating)
MAKHKVVIVGGGFGGVKAALELAKDRRFQITLISKRTDFRIYGMLYRVATGGSKEISGVPLQDIFADKPVNLLHDNVVAIDRQQRTVKTEINHTVSFDALILAMGVTTNYFNIKGLKEYSFGIKSLADAQELKNHLHKQLINERRPDLNYVVIGGGPTGVELAGALPEYVRKISKQHNIKPRDIHVDLIEAAPRLLPRMPKDLSRSVARQLRKHGIRIYVNTAVQAQSADALMIHDKPIRSHTVVWTAGVTNRKFFSNQGFQIARNGRVRVDQYLQAEPGIYVIGDNADTPYSGMAQTALHDGIFVAQNLIRKINNQEPIPYKAKKPIYVLPAGPRYAAVLWGPVRIYGFLGWVLRRLADLVAYHDYEPWYMATKRWMKESYEEESCPYCADDMARSSLLADHDEIV